MVDSLISQYGLGELHAVIDSNSYQQLMNKTALLILVFLSLQVLLGILKVVWVLPLGIAVTHNAVAALLLLTITLNYIIYAQPTSQFN